MERAYYGTTREGRDVDEYKLTNAGGMEVRCIPYGCRITGVLLPSVGGKKTDIVLGYDSLSEYEDDHTFQGAVVGRYANRIAGAAFTLGGATYPLTQNDGDNYLHGSFHKKVFGADVLSDNSISFTYTSPDGEDGFPGEAWVAVTYTLTDENELVLEYSAVPTAPTHINLTNHSYFNLAGAQGGGSIENTLLQLNCNLFLEAGEDLLPTGRFLETAGGAFDFAAEKPIGQDIGADDPQLAMAGGYDHCFVVNRQRPTMLAHAGTARHAASGRTLRVYTTQPGMQLYTGNFLSGVCGKGGAKLARRTGFCLETQHYPCTPNFPGNPNFPATLMRAGEKYHQITVWQFDW